MEDEGSAKNSGNLFYEEDEYDRRMKSSLMTVTTLCTEKMNLTCIMIPLQTVRMSSTLRVKMIVVP
jgi:hypothetical protein